MDIRVKLNTDSVEVTNIPTIDTNYDRGFNNIVMVIRAAITGLKDAQPIQPKKKSVIT